MSFVARKPLSPPAHASVISELLGDPSLSGKSSAALQELRCISLERDAGIFQESLMAFGLRQEDAGNEALAIRAYQALQNSDKVSPKISKQAKSRLQAFTGQGGSLGDQVEVFSHRIVKQAPAALLTMGPAYLAFSPARLAIWNGLAGRVAANVFTRSGAKALASLLAVGLVEGPVLTATQRALGPSTGSWADDLTANYRLMLGLRAAGGLGTLLTRGAGLRGALRAGVQQAATLGGIYLTHPETSAAQALQTLAYFQVNGALVGGILGRPFAARERALEQAPVNPVSSGSSGWRENLMAGSPRLAQVSAGVLEPTAKSLHIEPRQRTLEFDQVYAKGLEGGAGPGRAGEKGVPPPKMIRIPGGRFRMGSKDFKEARPARDVEVSDFFLGETPVANAQYRQHVEARQAEPFVLLETAPDTGLTKVVDVGGKPELVLPRYLHGEINGWDPSSPLIRGGLTLLKVAEPNVPEGFDGPNQPVMMVNWYEALAYAALTVKGGRLSTEAEWEKAARGPRGLEYGTRSGKLNKEEAHYVETRTANVGSYPSNGYGLYDMTGNVWEWTGDYYQDFYERLLDRNPTGPVHGIYKALRGGSWIDFNPDFLRAAHRYGSHPDGRGLLIGFRVAAPVPQDSK